MDIAEGLIRNVIVSAGDRDITYLRGQTIAKGALKIVDITFDKAYSEHYQEARYNILPIDIQDKIDTTIWIDYHKPNMNLVMIENGNRVMVKQMFISNLMHITQEHIVL